MNTPLNGLLYLIDGFGLITKPGLRRFVIFPLLINIIFFIALFFFLRHYFADLNIWLTSFLPSWLSWLAKVFWILFFFSFFIIFISFFVTVANIFSAPFNSFLAEKVELNLTGAIPEPRTLMENLKDVPRIIGRQLSILGYYLPRALLIAILFFIPVVQILAAPLWFILNAWYLTLTYIDYPTDNHRVPIKVVRIWLEKRRWVALSFGICVLVASMIPILNFFVIPAAVAGATKFWVKEL